MVDCAPVGQPVSFSRQERTVVRTSWTYLKPAPTKKSVEVNTSKTLAKKFWEGAGATAGSLCVFNPYKMHRNNAPQRSKFVVQNSLSVVL